MRVLALVVAMALGTPICAQDFSIDSHLIDRCLAIQDDPMVCVGQQADVCVQRNGGGADMVIGACMEVEAEFWDGALNRAYADLVALARAREAADMGYEPGSLVTGLRDMQRAWIGYRDATCANALSLAAPFGSAAGPAGAGCRMDQTARQYFVLVDLRYAYQN